LHSLHLLGDASSKQEMIALAETKDLFAIAALHAIAEGEDCLRNLILSSDIQVRLNAVIALLRLRSPYCYPALKEFLIRDSKDIGFQLVPSPGGTLTVCKAIPSL